MGLLDLDDDQPAPKKKATAVDLLDDGDAVPAINARAFTRAQSERPENPWDGPRRNGPAWSTDLQRILALPRRQQPTSEEMEAMADALTAELRWDNPRCECARLRPDAVARGLNPCITRFRGLQAWCLTEARDGGVIGALPVGTGKTGVDIFLPMVAPAKSRADGQPPLFVLLIPPNLRTQFRHDFEVWSQHFRVPNLVGANAKTFRTGRPRLEVLAYSELSRERCATWLTSRGPDGIIADEAQNLSDAESVRTSRFLRFMEKFRGCLFFCHSGSLSAQSIQDFTHLSALSLGFNSPLPIAPNVARAWAAVLDPTKPGVFRPEPGCLEVFCKGGKEVRVGFARHMAETRGFIATSEEALTTRLTLAEFKPPPMPERVQEALNVVRAKGTRPDWMAPGSTLEEGEGEELVDGLQVAAVCRQLASGFFYRFKFPRGEPPELIDEWFLKRQEWNRELRTALGRRREGMDSPKLLRDAAIRAWRGYRGEKPVWRSETWPAWAEIRGKVYKETETVWISDWLARAAVAWARQGPGIVWYTQAALGGKVAQLGKIAQFGAGADEISFETGTRPIVASVDAHGTGKNLQMFTRNLFLNPMLSGRAWEQGLGRTHRFGQTAEAVTAEVTLHTEELRDGFAFATERARYYRDLLGPQKLLYALRAADLEAVFGEM